MISFSPFALISPLWANMSHKRGAEHNAIRIVGIVVVIVAVGIDVPEIVGVVRIPQPPITSRRRQDNLNQIITAESVFSI